MAACWEYFEHPEGVGLRGYGASKAEAFAQAAVALVALRTDPRFVEASEEIQFDCEAPDDAALLRCWIEALNAQMKARRMLFCDFRLQFEGEHLHAHVWGERVDPTRHGNRYPLEHLRADGLSVGCDDEGDWVAQAVVY